MQIHTRDLGLQSHPRTRQKNKRGFRTGESNDRPEIPCISYSQPPFINKPFSMDKPSFLMYPLQPPPPPPPFIIYYFSSLFLSFQGGVPSWVPLGLKELMGNINIIPKILKPLFLHNNNIKRGRVTTTDELYVHLCLHFQIVDFNGINKNAHTHTHNT